jgi:hypothetical protein
VLFVASLEVASEALVRLIECLLILMLGRAALFEFDIHRFVRIAQAQALCG